MSGPTLPDAAVEAAAQAMVGPLYEPTKATRDDARVALLAAYPYLAADAWDEGHEAGYRVFERRLAGNGTAPFMPNPYRGEEPT